MTPGATMAAPARHAWLRGLLGDPETEAALSSARTMAHMLAFEAALAEACAAEGLVPLEAASAIRTAMASFRADAEALDRATARDGVVVPELVRQLKAHVGAPHGVHVHAGATSQDVVDTALALALRDANAVFEARLIALAERLAALGEAFGTHRLMARTRMRAALPIAVADRVASWADPLERHVQRLHALAPALHRLELGGPVGTRQAFGEKGERIAQRMAQALGLTAPDRARHAVRDVWADYASFLSLVSGSLGKIGQDVALMAQDGIGEIELEGTGGSSAMAHKSNPVAAEILVSLARFNAVQVAGLHQALVHEQERSGAAWTLEWMILPPMVVCTGASLRTGLALVGSVRHIGSGAQADRGIS